MINEAIYHIYHYKLSSYTHCMQGKKDAADDI